MLLLPCNSLPTMLVLCLRFTALATVHFSARARTISMSLHPWSCVPRAHSLFISVAQISGILGNLLGGVLFDTIGGKAFYGVTACVFLVSGGDLRRKLSLPPQ